MSDMDMISQFQRSGAYDGQTDVAVLPNTSTHQPQEGQLDYVGQHTYRHREDQTNNAHLG
jgi:hypothetical protein